MLHNLGVVQHVEVPILTLNQCRNMKYRSSRITPNMVCAGKGKQDSCQVSIQRQTNAIIIALHAISRCFDYHSHYFRFI